MGVVVVVGWLCCGGALASHDGFDVCGFDVCGFGFVGSRFGGSRFGGVLWCSEIMGAGPILILSVFLGARQYFSVTFSRSPTQCSPIPFPFI